MKRILAFTIIELLVAMALSGIIVAFAYNVYAMTNDSYKRLVDQNGEKNEIFGLQSLLEHDFDVASRAFYEQGEVRIELTDKSTVNYRFLADVLIRKEGVRIDTFRLLTYETSFSYLFDTPPLLEMLVIKVGTPENLYYTLNARIDYSGRMKFFYGSDIDFNN